MMLRTDDRDVLRQCDLRSECQTESDRRYIKDLFERKWDAFVIRSDRSGRFRTFLECCQQLFKI
jgi:hypothetical protein